jgi:large subunit ribosomal protein L29
MLRADEIREMSEDDLRGRVAELEEERFRLKFRSATETLEDPLRLRFIRRDIARLKTIAHERGIGLAGGAQPRPAEGSEGTATTSAARTSAGRKSGSRKAAKKSGSRKAAAKKSAGRARKTTTTARKSSAKKSAGKKTAAKKSTAKKSAARKSSAKSAGKTAAARNR